MQRITFTQKLSRQRRPLNTLLSLVALLLCLSASQYSFGQIFTSSSLVIVASPTGAGTTSTTYYGAQPTASTPKFNGAQLSTAGSDIDPFNASGTLTIARVDDAINPRGTEITSSNFYYRVYRAGTPQADIPTFITVNLAQASATNTSNPTTFAYTTPIDLLAVPRASGGGTYIVDIYYDQTNQEIGDPTTEQTGNSPANGPSAPFSATFRVTAPATTPVGGTTTWQGTANSTVWNLSTNWSNGVPTRNSNAIIPERQQGVLIVYPILDNGEVVEVNNLTLVGQSNSSRGELTVERATLVVFGNLRQNAGGLRGTVTQAPGVRNAALNSTLVLAGGNQVVTGRLGMSDVIIAGSGVKSITGVLSPSNTLSFQPTNVANGVIAQSAFEDPGSAGTVTPVFDTTLQTLIDLGTTGLINQEPGNAETNTSYVKGVLRSDRPISPAPQIFGNIGLDISANYTSVVNLIIFRIVGDPLQSPTSNNSGTVAVPVKRQYLVDNALDSENPSFAGTTLSFVFHYLDSADELNGIPEGNLSMFRSRSNGPPYAPVFGTRDTNANTVTRAGLPSFSRFTLTLGDRLNPLPVRLTAFDAKRAGNDALITWQTANEQNSKGYEVQVSTNGTEFRTLASVPSAAPNTTTTTNYSYIDTEKNKAGLRYYRLRQIDVDGKDAFFAPKSVSFDGKVTESSLAAYPNPFEGSEQLHLSVQSAAGKGNLLMTDMTGRTIRQESIDFTAGLNDLTVGNAANLQAGIYLMRVSLPSGETKTLKVVKK